MANIVMHFAKTAPFGHGSARNAETNLGAAGMTARATRFQHETEFLET
jgi:hypothetical protein